MQLVEEGEPFDFAEEAKRERNAVVGVSEPIHDGEGVKGEESVAGVVLEDDETAGDAEGLFEEDCGVLGVMEDIDEHDGVKGAIGEGYRRAVEMLYGDRGRFSELHINSGEFDVGAELFEAEVDFSVAAADIEEGSVWREEWSDGLGEFDPAALEEDAFDERSDRIHAGGFMRRMRCLTEG